MQIPKNVDKRETKDWLKVLKRKTAGNLIIGFLFGVSLTLAFLAYIFYM